MKLWLLRRPADSPGVYDCADGFVVAAPDEETARRLAEQNHGDESSLYRPLWLDPATPCRELRAEDYQGARVVLRDFHAG